MSAALEGAGSIDKALDLLFELHRASAPRGVSELGRALGLPRSTAHRLLAALSRRALVESDGRGRYRPGIGLVALGLGALEREPVALAARPVLEAEAADLGETVFLVGARAGQAIVLDKVEGTGFLRAAPRIGEAVPIHATAVGKLFLAFGAGAVAAPSGRLPRHTPKTAADARSLAREVARARSRGFAENREEWIPGLSVVAAPILRERAPGRGGGELVREMVGAIAVAAPSARFEALGPPALARRVRRAAARSARRLEGEP